MSWTVSNLQRPFREDFSLEKSGIIAEKESQIFGCRFVGFDGRKSGALFQFLKGRWLQRLKRQAGEDLSDLIFLQQEDRSHGHPKHSRQLRYLEEVCTVQALEPCRWRESS